MALSGNQGSGGITLDGVTRVPRITDQNEIRSILETDRGWAAYALGDLSPGFFELSEWYRPAGGGAALVLILRVLSLPVLFTLGEPALLAPILGEIAAVPQLYLNVRPEVLPLIKSRYVVEEETMMWRMLLDPAGYRPAPCEEAMRLGLDDFPALERLYADGEPTGEAPGFFRAWMLERGVFYGIHEDHSLVAAAGTHLVAPLEGVAAIGNVYTRRDRRSQGLAARVTSAVAGELLRMGLRTIALNADQQNLTALRVYERLGFKGYCPFYEGRASRGRTTPGAPHREPHLIEIHK
jgi:GNAT superfamily N-acetyltransferase